MGLDLDFILDIYGMTEVVPSRAHLSFALNYSITRFPNRSIRLPLSSFHHLFDFAFHQIALQRTDMADIKLAVQVIGFVEESAGEQIFSRFFVDFAFRVLGADRHDLGPRDVLAEVGDAEAAFALRMAAFGVNDFRVDQDKLGVEIFLESYVNDGDATGDADLRSGQTDSVGRVHGLEHIGQERPQRIVENRHGF